MKSLLFTWMERIFLYKEIPKSEFTYRNAKKLISGYTEDKITKKYLDDVVADFKVKRRIRRERQSHGFRWEQEILKNVYRNSTNIKYTNEFDLPGEFNNGINVNIKTTGSYNMVCMADCVRFFESLDKDLHLIVLLYKQKEDKKVIERVVKIDLTTANAILK